MKCALCHVRPGSSRVIKLTRRRAKLAASLLYFRCAQQLHAGFAPAFFSPYSSHRTGTFSTSRSFQAWTIADTTVGFAGAAVIDLVYCSVWV